METSKEVLWLTGGCSEFSGGNLSISGTEIIRDH